MDFTGDHQGESSAEQQNITNARNEAGKNAINEVLQSGNVVAKVNDTARVTDASFIADAGGDKFPVVTPEQFGAKVAVLPVDYHPDLKSGADFYVEAANKAGNTALAAHMQRYSDAIPRSA